MFKISPILSSLQICEHSPPPKAPAPSGQQLGGHTSWLPHYTPPTVLLPRLRPAHTPPRSSTQHPGPPSGCARCKNSSKNWRPQAAAPRRRINTPRSTPQPPRAPGHRAFTRPPATLNKVQRMDKRNMDGCTPPPFPPLLLLLLPSVASQRLLSQPARLTQAPSFQPSQSTGRQRLSP